jgi:sec-independent protein translocase protein TatA
MRWKIAIRKKSSSFLYNSKIRRQVFGFGIIELIIVLVILVVLFGASRLPEIGRGIDETIKSFKRSVSESSEIYGAPKNKTEKNEGNKGNKS